MGGALVAVSILGDRPKTVELGSEGAELSFEDEQKALEKALETKPKPEVEVAPVASPPTATGLAAARIVGNCYSQDVVEQAAAVMGTATKSEFNAGVANLRILLSEPGGSFSASAVIADHSEPLRGNTPSEGG